MNNKHIQKTVLRLFSERQECETHVPLFGGHEPAFASVAEDALPRHWRQFIKIAEHRKRAILEKMLLD